MKPLFVLVLAAGQGSRMKSKLPKVLHSVAGRPLLEHVLMTALSLKPRRTAVVLGVGREKVRASLDARGWKALDYCVQREPKGSGHAVMMARSWMRNKKGALLVVYGDTPLLTADTLQRLVREHARSNHAATFLAMEPDNPSGYGRMVCGAANDLEKIVEDKEATADEKKIRLVNSGVACWNIEPLMKVLPKLRPNNAKHEYYLTDAVALLRENGHTVGVVTADDAMETHGINTRVDLAECEDIFRKRILKKWMLAGVTITDPSTTYISAEATLAADCRVGPGSMILGKSSVATGSDIGPYSILEDAEVQEGARIGPFARLRPGSVIGPNAHVGNFVETKKTILGAGSKANHLTYLGDSRIGANVNVGAGTITCNYDGFTKSETVIEDGAFIGSNTNLVAPVRVGRGAIIGAGSTITKDVPAEALALTRAPQMKKEKWAATFRARHKKGHHA